MPDPTVMNAAYGIAIGGALIGALDCLEAATLRGFVRAVEQYRGPASARDVLSTYASARQPFFASRHVLQTLQERYRDK